MAQSLLMGNMGHKRIKLLRFAKLPDFDFVFDEKRNFSADCIQEKAQGRPIVLELGCGKGDYTLGLSKLFPEKFFVGMDVKGERIWVGASKVQEERRQNVAFVRGRIERILESFPKNFVDEIWITFPDPFPRIKQAKHRLTSALFLERYKNIIKKGASIVKIKPLKIAICTSNCEQLFFINGSVESIAVAPQIPIIGLG